MNVINKAWSPDIIVQHLKQHGRGNELNGSQPPQGAGGSNSVRISPKKLSGVRKECRRTSHKLASFMFNVSMITRVSLHGLNYS